MAIKNSKNALLQPWGAHTVGGHRKELGTVVPTGPVRMLEAALLAALTLASGTEGGACQALR